MFIPIFFSYFVFGVNLFDPVVSSISVFFLHGRLCMGLLCAPLAHTIYGTVLCLHTNIPQFLPKGQS